MVSSSESYKDFQNQKLSNDHAKGTTFGIRPMWGVFFLSLILSSFQMTFLPSSDDEMPVVSVIGEITSSVPRLSKNQEIFCCCYCVVKGGKQSLSFLLFLN